MKNKILSFAFILLLIICLCFPTFASTAPYALTAGSYITSANTSSVSSTQSGLSPIDTRQAVEYAANKYTAMGYNGSSRLDPSYIALMSCFGLKPKILFFDCHGNSTGLEFKNSNLTCDSRFTGDNVLNVTTRDLSKTQLVIYMACSTGALGVSNITKATAVLMPSGSCSIGWQSIINTTDSTKWSKRFHDALANGYTITNAIAYANDALYINNSIKQITKYGSNPTMSLVSTRSIPTLDNNRHYVTDTVNYNKNNLTNIDNLIKEEFNESSLSNYKTVVANNCIATDNENDTDVTIIDYILQVDGFTTQYGYSVYIEDNVVKYIVDNRVGNLPMTLSSYSLSNNYNTQIDSYKSESARRAMLAYPGSNNTDQEHIFYYDTQTGKRYIILNTTNVTSNGQVMVLSDYYEL